MFIRYSLCLVEFGQYLGPPRHRNLEWNLRDWRVGERFHALLKEAKLATGTVKFFNHSRGFGFIEPTDGGPDVFVHATAVERAGLPPLAEGQKLSYEVETDQRSGKSAAEHLQLA